MTPSSGTTMPGFVPQVTWGWSVAASITTSRSKRAPGSVRSDSHSSTARFQSRGERSLPAR